MALEPLEQITVAIGGESVTYWIAETSAPKAYDGFGTFTVAEYSGENGKLWRIVLIREENLNWQAGRYNSGLYYATKPTGFDVAAVAAHLWEKLQKGEQ